MSRRSVNVLVTAALCACSASLNDPRAAVARVTLSESTFTIVGVGARTMLVAVVEDSAGVIPNAPVTWSSSNASVALVAASGVNAIITGVSAGSADIVASAGSKTATAVVTVVRAVALTIVPAGDGNGRVASSPTSILCTTTGGPTTGTCADVFPEGTVVTLTALPFEGHRFVGWSGTGACIGQGPCAVTLDQSRTITATFASLCATAQPYVLGTVATGIVTALSCSRAGRAVIQYEYSVATQTVFTLHASAGSFAARIAPLANDVPWWYASAATQGADIATTVVVAPGTYRAFVGSATSPAQGAVDLSSALNPSLTCQLLVATAGVVVTSRLAADCATYTPVGFSGSHYDQQIYLVLPAGKTLTVRAQASGFAPLLELRDANNLLLRSTSGDEAVHTATLSFTTFETKNLRLDLSSRDALAVGAYVLTIEPASSAVAQGSSR
jgi:hypothetical protein